MTAWWEGPLVALDTETSGVDVTADRIVTACVIEPDGNTVDWLINPGIEIPEGATAVHGITTERARASGSDPAEAVNEIAVCVCAAWNAGIPVVAYNATFDLSILDHELARHGLPTLANRLDGQPMVVIDPLVIDRHVDRYRRGKRTLTVACEVYGVTLDDAHSADADAAAAVELARKLGASFPEVGEIPAGVLHGLQAKWHADWAANFTDYLRRQGKDEVIDPTWPIRPVEVASPVDRALALLLDEAWCANAGIQADVREVIVGALREKIAA